MTTATNIHHPDVPLPTGARVMVDWVEHSRVTSTDARAVEGTNIGVEIYGCQLPDGSFVPDDAPRIWVHSPCGIELTAAGARELSRVLTEFADQLDGWAVR
jgi:hypothetical protein